MCQLPKQHAPVETSTTKTQRQDLLHAQRCNLDVRFFVSPGQSHSFPPLSRITRTPSASRRPQRSRNEIPKVVKHDKQLSRPGAGLIIIGCEFKVLAAYRRSFVYSKMSADKSRRFFFARELEKHNCSSNLNIIVFTFCCWSALFFLSIALVYLEVNNNQHTPGGVERQQHNFNSH